jgi:hypothetical protein
VLPDAGSLNDLNVLCTNSLLGRNSEFVSPISEFVRRNSEFTAIGFTGRPLISGPALAGFLG